MKPMVSVIVPIYNVEQYLCQCVESIRNQTLKNIEIILVDDGSPDSCGAICDDYAQKDSRIVVIHKQNGGLSSARNAGLRIAKGDYVGFIDSDDYIKPDMFEKLYHACVDNDLQLAVCNFNYVIDEREQIEKESNEVKILSSEKMFEIILSLGNRVTMIASNKLYHRSIFDKMPEPFPEGRINEDLATMYQFIFATDRVAHVDTGLYCYRWLREGAITTRKYGEHEKDRIEFGNKMVAYVEKNVPGVYEQALVFKFINCYLSTINCMVISDVYDEKMFKPLQKEIRSKLGIVLRSDISMMKKIQLVVCCVNFCTYRICMKRLKY